MDEADFAALPRGRHNLTRDQVESAQRGRLLYGMAMVVAEKGYAATSVADVLKRVHISRDTFYQHFSDKEDCFLAALDGCAALLTNIVEVPLAEPDLDPLDQFDRAMALYLNTIVAQSALAKMYFLESFAAGERARRIRFAVQAQMGRRIVETFAGHPGWAGVPDPDFAVAVIGGAVSSMVMAALAEDRIGDIPGLREPIIAFLRYVLTP
ncbi:Transcriptional regulator, TetR family [Alloactinosynnema sp. L-07]|uniref:TetR/AcrR family transcriptional regulator n=1 Tax=Alloactinosynnema sp. L-07 TaxID=1653480 RepID=UPI00065F00D4|nr:TetR/AcrR family transcriptional regulator [Alloactinosynnema sp. L-07]CRK57115.1 Transcriptional regulator, TetR family [Alloactinosynnema sp. L-07]